MEPRGTLAFQRSAVLISAETRCWPTFIDIAILVRNTRSRDRTDHPNQAKPLLHGLTTNQLVGIYFLVEAALPC